MSKPFLVIQLRPETEVADSELKAIAAYSGLRAEEIVRLRAEHTGLPAIELGDYSAIIVGGSPFDISTPEGAKTQTQRRIEDDFMVLLDHVVEADFPFLGACSGSSLLGRFCGARISTTYAEPIGGVNVRLTEEGSRDPLLRGFPETFRVLVGHKEALDEVPPGSVLLASSSACPVQMFRLGESIYATQFHPEADREGFVLRIKAYRGHGYFPPHTAEDLIASIANEKTPVPRQMLARFVRRYRV